MPKRHGPADRADTLSVGVAVRDVRAAVRIRAGCCGKLDTEMRRTIPLLLTLFLLICAQSAGLMHGIGHGSARHAAATGRGASLSQSMAQSTAGERSRVGPAGSESGDGSCEKCFQFAHFSGSAAPQAPLIVLAQTIDAPARCPQATLVARDAPASRSRGPPVYL